MNSVGYGIGPSSFIKAKILARLLKKYGVTDYADVGCGKGLLFPLVKGGVGYDIVPLNGVEYLDIERAQGGRHQAVVGNALIEALRDIKNSAHNLSSMANEYIFILTQWKGASISVFDRENIYRKYDEKDIQRLFPDFYIVESFIFGWPMYSLYYWFLQKLPKKEGVAQGPKPRWVIQLLSILFQLDRLFTTKGRLLVCVLKKKKIKPPRT